MKRVFYLIFIALVGTACWEPHFGTTEETIQLYGKNVEVSISVLTFEK